MPFSGNFVLLRRNIMSLYEFHTYENNYLFKFHHDLIDKRIELHNTPNWHEDIELLHCTEGAGEVIINSEHVPMEKGTIAIINPNKIHYLAPESDIFRFQVLIIDSKFLKASGIDIKKMDFENSIYDEKASSFYKIFVDAYESKAPFSNIAANGLALALMAHIANFYSSEKKQSSDEDKIIKAIEYIRENFKEAISVDDVAEHSGFSRYYFSRKFKQISGFSVNEYIQMFRCREAHAMLETHKYTVTEVAAECGFSDASYFTKVYRKFFPALPSQIKRK